MLLFFSSIPFSLFRHAGQSRARLELIQHTAHLLQRTDVAPAHRVKLAQIHAARNCSKGVVRLQRQRKGVFPPAKAQQLPFDAAAETCAAQRRTSPRKTMLLQVSKPSWGVPL